MRFPGWMLLSCAVLALVAFATACGGDDDDDNAAAALAASSLMPTPAGSEFFDIASATTTASGLMYIDETAGTGDSPAVSQSVTVNYTGRLASDGSVFDSTTGRGPATFALTRVIPGFSEGILTMKVGGKRTVYIPAELAYGANPPPGLPANANLIFDIQLLSIQ